jgi:peptide/nickel transport system substrate-binding protein
VHRKLHRVVLAFAAALLAIALAACGSTKKPSAAPSSSTAGNAPAGGTSTFTYGTYTDVMVGWDPSTSYSNEILAMQNMYETLTRYDSQTKKVMPLLATSWTSSKDGKTWTFTLRKGVTFHSGRPMTAAAAKAAIERTIKLNQGAAYIWGSVKSIDAKASTLVFHLKYAAPLDLIASADYAAYIFDTKAAPASNLAKWFAAAHDAGTGPYEIDKYAKGQEVEVRLKAFPKYWGAWNGAHYQRIVFRVVPQATTSAQLLRAGELSFAERLTPQLRDSFKSDSNIALTSQTSFQNLLAMLNTKSGPLANRTVREGVAYAIDYSGIAAALHGGGTQSHGLIPPGLLGHSNSITGFPHDPTKAKQLLAQAGYGAGKKKLSLTLTYTQGDADQSLVSTLIKSDLAAIGADVTVQPLAWPTQWDKAKSSNLSRRQDILVFYWWPDYADPYSWFINLVHTEKQPYFNLSYYANPQVDKLIDKAPSLTATNRQAADRLYVSLQKTLMHDVPLVPMYDQVYQRTMLKSVGGFVENPAYPNVVFAYNLHPQKS